jgi:hypothetical protein
MVLSIIEAKEYPKHCNPIAERVLGIISISSSAHKKPFSKAEGFLHS